MVDRQEYQCGVVTGVFDFFFSSQICIPSWLWSSLGPGVMQPDLFPKNSLGYYFLMYSISQTKMAKSASSIALSDCSLGNTRTDRIKPLGNWILTILHNVRILSFWNWYDWEPLTCSTEVFLLLLPLQIASTSSVESMPGTDASSTSGGVSGRLLLFSR